MRLNELADKKGARSNPLRVGRGIGSTKGKTAGRGVKGQKSRSGHKVNGFEGGQMAIFFRLPKRGFTNPAGKTYAVINLDTLQAAVDAGRLDAAKPVTAEALTASGIITHARDGVRLLGRGKLSAKLNIEIAGASKAAQTAVEKAGGSICCLTSANEKAES